MCPHKIDVNVKLDPNAMQHEADVATHQSTRIEQCVQALAHSCFCHDAFCPLIKCTKMKRFVKHTIICKPKVKGTCPICRQLIALYVFHAKTCKAARCMVPFCITLRTQYRHRILPPEQLDDTRDLPDTNWPYTIDVVMSGSPTYGNEVPSGGDSSSGIGGDKASGISGDKVFGISGDQASGIGEASASGISGNSASGIGGTSASGIAGDSASGISDDSASGIGVDSAFIGGGSVSGIGGDSASDFNEPHSETSGDSSDSGALSPLSLPRRVSRSMLYELDVTT